MSEILPEENIVEPVESTEVSELDKARQTLSSELQQLKIDGNPFDVLIDNVIRPQNERVANYLQQNAIVIPPIWYQEDHAKILPTLLLYRYLPILVRALGSFYGTRTLQYFEHISQAYPEDSKLMLMLFEDLIIHQE